jgi:hypothetical protein
MGWSKSRFNATTGRVHPCRLMGGRFAPARGSGSRRRGIVLAWVAVTIFVLAAIVGLSLDWGKLAFNVHQLQNAADAGALAGAQLVKFDVAGARQKAIAVAFQNWAENQAVTVADNPANAADGELVIGRWIRQERLFFETLVAPSAVKVVASRWGQRSDAPALSLLFGPLFGSHQTPAGRHAIGWARGSSGSGIICLADDPSVLPGWTGKDTGLRVDGNPIIDLRGVDAQTGDPMIGDIQVNAASERPSRPAVSVNGTSASLYAGELNVVGATNPNADDAGAWAGLFANSSDPFSVNPQSARLADPLAGLTPPDIRAMPPGSDTTGKQYYDPGTGAFTTITGGTLTLNPGYYPGGIDMSGGTITLKPGVYAFGGGTAKNNPPGLVVNGGTVLGTGGVMLYITGDPDASKTGTKTQYGRVAVGGNGCVELTSRGDVDPGDAIGINGETGIAIWQDRDNHNYATVGGTSDSWIKGTLYFGYNAVEIGGTPGQMGNQVLAGALWVHGTPDLIVPYDGRNTIEKYRSVLVE